MIINIGPSKGNIISCLAVPNNAIIYRIKSRTKAYGFGIFYAGEKEQQPYIFLAGKSETESQKWMQSIRDVLKSPKYPKATNEYTVSVIDNEHSKRAGLTGLYGTLSVKADEILVTDPHTGKTKVTLHWTQIQCSYLPLPAVSDDLHKVCTIRTNSKFRAGDGDLELFCCQADELHKEMLSCPRPLPRIATTPLPPTPKDKQMLNDWSDSPSMTPPRCLFESRRMSRSEGDLKKFVMQQQQPLLRSAGSQQHLILLPQNNLTQKSSSHYLLTSVGLLLTTPGYSEPNSMQDLRLIDQNLLSKRLQNIANEEHRNIEEKSENEDYEEMLRTNEEQTNDTPPPLPPRQLKYVSMANLGGNNKLYISGPVPI
ncbi:uncharacterized protein LOC112684482 isoform X2 [Sipha flava]|nr:uncharacterized protein LOC112684482 isoform X2 [Sipha flava]